jgi:GxxExxY protein
MATDTTNAFGGAPSNLIHGETSDRVLAAYYAVYRELGAGFLESVYSKAFSTELQILGTRFEANVPIDVFYKGVEVGFFRADHIVEGRILVELKAADALVKEHEQQVLNYLSATKLEVGLLLNFGPRPTFKRFVLTNERKKALAVSV